MNRRYFMYEEILKDRLKNLYGDLTLTNREAVSLVNFMNQSMDDKHDLIKDIYFRDMSPVRVLNPGSEIPGQKGPRDQTDEFIDVCEGYDVFIRNIGSRTSYLLEKHSRAVELFVDMLSLPHPYARILYMRFVKSCSIEDVGRELYMSKSACYRKQEKAIKMLFDIQMGSGNGEGNGIADKA